MRVLVGLLFCACLSAGAAPLRTVDEVRATGSLRGSELDGAWALPPRGRFQPEAALIRRFDHLLSAIGECGLPEIRRFIEREVVREQGAAAATQVLASWDDHLALLQGRPTSNPPLADNPYPVQEPRPPRPARKVPATPRSLLAPDEPATPDDTKALQAQRVERFGEVAAERLRREDQLRWDWSRRLAQARAELQNVTPAQRESTLARRFSGPELLRARTLLGFPP